MTEHSPIQGIFRCLKSTSIPKVITAKEVPQPDQEVQYQIVPADPVKCEEFYRVNTIDGIRSLEDYKSDFSVPWQQRYAFINGDKLQWGTENVDLFSVDTAKCTVKRLHDKHNISVVNIQKKFFVCIVSMRFDKPTYFKKKLTDKAEVMFFFESATVSSAFADLLKYSASGKDNWSPEKLRELQVNYNFQSETFPSIYRDYTRIPCVHRPMLYVYNMSPFVIHVHGCNKQDVVQKMGVGGAITGALNLFGENRKDRDLLPTDGGVNPGGKIILYANRCGLTNVTISVYDHGGQLRLESRTFQGNKTFVFFRCGPEGMRDMDDTKVMESHIRASTTERRGSNTRVDSQSDNTGININFITNNGASIQQNSKVATYTSVTQKDDSLMRTGDTSVDCSTQSSSVCNSVKEIGVVYPMNGYLESVTIDTPTPTATSSVPSTATSSALVCVYNDHDTFGEEEKEVDIC